MQKAYLQISFDDNDKDFLRFYGSRTYLINIDQDFVNTNLSELQSQRIVYHFIVNNHISKYGVFNPKFVKKVLKEFCVGDLNSGINSVKEVVEPVKKIRVRFSEVQFNVRKFRSNSKELSM